MRLQFGLTLIECIIVILILTIISLYALPSFQQTLANQESETILSQVKTNLEYAKTQARLYKKNVVLCSSNNQKTCNTTEWSQGFIMFFDDNKNHTLDKSDQIIQTYPIQPKYGQFTWSGPRPRGVHKNSVSFYGDTGLPRGSQGSFIYCSNIAHHKKLVLSMMGQTRIEKLKKCD